MTPVDTRLTCAACGHQGYDVLTRIVEREPTPDDPTLYASEARCIDRTACEVRQEEDLDERAAGNFA